VVERGPDAIRSELIGVLRGILLAGRDRAELIARFADPATRIVTLTITPSGYATRGATLAQDGALQSGHCPSDAIGLIVSGLAAVRAKGKRPPVLLSCDNLPNNGPHLRDAVVARAALADPSLASWIPGNVQFPCSVVDRIVPVPTSADSAEASRMLGLQDLAAVSTETYKQWVIEDFDGDRPRWELAGAEFVSDVRPWEASKLSLLNGTHMAIAYLGLLSGIWTVADFVLDPLFLRYTSRLMLEEQLPTIGKSDHDLHAYSGQLIERWRNTGVLHRLDRVGRNGSEKLAPRLLGSLFRNMVANRPAPCTTLAVAAWVCCATRLLPLRVSLEDPAGDLMLELARRAGGNTERLVDSALALREIFGSDLPQMPQFRASLCRAIDLIRAFGTRGATSIVLAEDRKAAKVSRELV
jgi:fructuronate reductase